MMEASHLDPALRYARTIMKEAGNALWWKPGTQGRGFVVRDTGEVHHWPEADGAHIPMAKAKGIPLDQMEDSSFLIRRDGTTVFPYAHNPWGDQDPRAYEAWLMDTAQKADPRLNPVSYDPKKGIAQAYGKTADNYEKLWNQRVGEW